MLSASVIAIFIIPVTFYVVERLTGRGKEHSPETALEAPEPAIGD
jgi:hypothetical protein